MSDLPKSKFFDIPDIGGINDSERLLATLCQKSFLSLWSFSNLYTDEDLRNGKGSGKELCDVLVVFGDHVIIFSDKHITFQNNKPLSVAWPRWYKRAVASSVDQLYGAMNWLKRFPERVFLDACCTRPLPVEVPLASRAKYHLIAVTRGTLDACKRYFNGGFGTPVINTSITGNEHHERPFQVGIPNPGKPFVHILDEFSLELLHQEVDTIADLTTYLAARENLLSRDFKTVVAVGEEQLLAVYLTHMKENEHTFIPTDATNVGEGGTVQFEAGFFENLKGHPSYLAKKKADEISYSWDRLVERFIRLGDPTLARPDLKQSSSDIEEGLRIMAAESRFRRRSLIVALRSIIKTAHLSAPGRHARIVTSNEDTGLIYIFLIFPKFEDETYEEYRSRRVFYLEAYCRCAKLKFADAHTFVGLAFDHPAKTYEGWSEDLIVVKQVDLSSEDRQQLEDTRRTLGILSEDMTVQPYHASEYPKILRRSPEQNSEFVKAVDRNPTTRKFKKSKERIAKASRKRNRR